MFAISFIGISLLHAQDILGLLPMSDFGTLICNMIDVVLTYVILLVVVAGVYPILNKELLNTLTAKP